MALRFSGALLLPMALLLSILAPAALPRSAFLGVGQAPTLPAGGAMPRALGAPLLPNALASGGEPTLCIMAGAALALAMAARARRCAAGGLGAGGRAARCGRMATTQQEIKELEALYRRKDRASRGWFGFGRKKEERTPEPTMPALEELPEDLRALVEESRELTQRVAQLDMLSSLRKERDAEQVAKAKEELPAAEEVAAQPEAEVAGEQAATEAPIDAQLPAEDTFAVEAAQELALAEEAAVAEELGVPEETEPVPEEPAATAEEQPALEEEVAVEEQAGMEEQEVAEEQDVTEVLSASEGQPTEEQPAMEVQAATEVRAATQEESAAGEQAADVEEPTEAQKAAMALLDKHNDTLNRVLVMARELDADNQKLKDDLKAAQKKCYDLLNKELDAASAAKVAEAQAA